MSKRNLKKITVASIFFTIFIFIPAFLVFVFTDFSVNNPIDSTPAEIKVESVKKIDLSENKVSLVAKLRNPNSDFGVRSFDYNFVKKEDSEKVTLSKGTSFILPSQTKHLLKLEVPVAEIPKGELSLELKNVDWKQAQGVRTDSIWVANGQYSSQGSSTKVTGTLINESPLLIEKVQVRALVFDKDDSLLGVTRTQLGNVQANEKRDIKTYMSYPITKSGTLIFEADANLMAEAN